MDLKEKKNCEICGVEYLPRGSQWKRQKYCSRKCKEKARYFRAIEEGKPKKGGYSRSTYIRVWMRARGEKDFTAPCAFCGKRLAVDDGFHLAHTKPRHLLNYEETKSEEYLTLSCRQCNQAMGQMTKEDFLGEKK